MKPIFILLASLMLCSSCNVKKKAVERVSTEIKVDSSGSTQTSLKTSEVKSELVSKKDSSATNVDTEQKIFVPLNDSITMTVENKDGKISVKGGVLKIKTDKSVTVTKTEADVQTSTNKNTDSTQATKVDLKKEVEKKSKKKEVITRDSRFIWWWVLLVVAIALYLLRNKNPLVLWQNLRKIIYKWLAPPT